MWFQICPCSGVPCLWNQGLNCMISLSRAKLWLSVHSIGFLNKREIFLFSLHMSRTYLLAVNATNINLLFLPIGTLRFLWSTKNASCLQQNLKLLLFFSKKIIPNPWNKCLCSKYWTWFMYLKLKVLIILVIKLTFFVCFLQQSHHALRKH